jgi:hypothetical protein
MDSEHFTVDVAHSCNAGSFHPAYPATPGYNEIIEEVCSLSWAGLSKEELISVAWIYYYFSVQFCENVGIARALYPDDERLEALDRGERNTDNLSPCAGVVAVGEKVDHDEFMRRTLLLSPLEETQRRRLMSIGQSYLEKIRAFDDQTRASSLATYEDGGLEKLFRNILRAKHWDDPTLQAFKHFLIGHIQLDGNPCEGHGALCRHLLPNAHVHELWIAFKESLIAGAPGLAR